MERSGSPPVNRSSELAELVDTVPLPRSSVAVLAVGGYGRGELSPHSDVDLLILVDDKRRPSPEDLRGLLYPLWDAGSRSATPSARPRRRSSGQGETWRRPPRCSRPGWWPA